MAIMASERVDRDDQPVPNAPLVADPTEPVSVSLAPVGPDCAALVPVLVLPGGTRIYVDVSSTFADAARWWHDLGVAALSAATCYED